MESFKKTDFHLQSLTILSICYLYIARVFSTKDTSFCLFSVCNSKF